MTVRSLTRCPGMVHFIHAAIYDFATETCGKTHFKVDLSFPGRTSQVCSVVWFSEVVIWNKKDLLEVENSDDLEETIIRKVFMFPRDVNEIFVNCDEVLFNTYLKS